MLAKADKELKVNSVQTITLIRKTHPLMECADIKKVITSDHAFTQYMQKTIQ